MDLSQQDLKQIAKEFTDGLLNERATTDMCYAVCSPLQSYLDMFDIDCKLVKGDFLIKDVIIEHYWIEMDDNSILDPTADQLSKQYDLPELPMIFIGNKPDWYPTPK